MFLVVSVSFSQSHHRDADILFYIKIDMGGTFRGWERREQGFGVET
jgi:hypothetical protein